MQGFKALQVKFNKSLSSHILYVKPHCVRDKIQEKPPERTLFVVGVPPYFTEDSIRKLFNTYGSIQAVYLHKTPSAHIPVKEESKYFPLEESIKGFKIAYIVFLKKAAVRKALDTEEILHFSSDLIFTGMKKWNRQYNERFIDKNELEEEIKAFMNKFDEETSRKNRLEKDALEPQNGWITVTRRGRKPGFARKDSVAKQLKKRGERQRRKKELKNFYTFQIKESKMKNLVALRKKFEDDKRKIVALKEARRFKPF